MNARPATSRARSALLLLLLLPAVVVPFVPFAYEVSPLMVVAEFVVAMGRGKLSGQSALILFAVPFFLGVPIVGWQVRRLCGAQIAPIERAVAFALAGVSATLSLVLVVYVNTTGPIDSKLHDFLFVTLPPMVGAVLLRWLVRYAPRADLPPAILALAFLTNPVVGILKDLADHAAIGWWLTLVSSAGLVAQLAHIVRRTLAARRLAAQDSIVDVAPPAGSAPTS